MKLVILRSTPSGRIIRPEDHYLQQFNTHYADRVVGNLRGEPTFCTSCAEECIHCRKPYRIDFSRDIAAVFAFPDVLPYVLETPREFMPETVPEHDVLLALHVHEQILLEFLKGFRGRGIKAVVVPLEAPDWISRSARTQARRLCEAEGIEIDFPKPFCGFKPPEGTVLAAFRKHFKIGYPEVEIAVKGRKITKAHVVASAACGSTYYIARWLVGRSLDDDLATEVISKRLHSYPCTASMERDPELDDDTALHIAGQAHNQILAGRTELPPLRMDRVKSPLGIWVQKATLPTDSLKSIEQAKAAILEHLRENPDATVAELREKVSGLKPALAISALLLLKKEGKLKSS